MDGVLVAVGSLCPHFVGMIGDLICANGVTRAE
jgi:hypothetical protein